MQTIAKETVIHGKGLMSGLECNVKIFPTEEQGIRFYLPNIKKPVAALAENVVSTDNCVVLANDEGAKIVLVEHFMAACAFAGINSLDVFLSSYELPILDGSALEWYNLLDKKENAAEITTFDSPICTDKIIFTPADELKLTYCVDFNHPELKNRWVSYDLSKDKMEIISARTFGYLKDLERFQQAGMALGVTKENTVGLTDEAYTVPLRSEFEPAKHKILDLIGDLSLTGLNPLGFKAHIIAIEAGHKAHTELAKLIQQKEKQK